MSTDAPTAPTTPQPLPGGASAPDGYQLVTLGPDDRDAYLGVDVLAFGQPDLEDPPVPVDWSRAAGVRTTPADGAAGELAAVHASYPFDLPVPGARLPAAGLTWLSVHPLHRRRRLASAMIAHHLQRTAARGEPLSVLTASEASIYGRFGYGSAAPVVTVTVPRGAALRPVPGSERLTTRLERADATRHAAVVHAVHTAAGAAGPGRPGWAPRSTPALQEAFFWDPPGERHGAEALLLLTVSDPGAEDAGHGTRAHALVARTPTTVGGDLDRVRVREAAAVDPAAARALWGVLLDLDLTTVVEARLPVDDALLHQLVDARSARPVVRDQVWVRLVDLPAALAGRRYPAPVDVVLEVTDALLPANAGRWHLVGGPQGAQVTRTGSEAHLALDVRDLGAAYLGGVGLAALAGAGLVRELVPGTLAPASTAFGWPLAPACSWTF
ncbi:MAG: Enhanced intracellular survival protein [uncultured Quadrisphaera sp.]|uniref:Enhanced intracellular survival protein n=1 Tax=uncultured Quadrisphaera sp. TaxID=904978 RepID=A0A6J4NTT1_9ACTN|nr:MAG: Enhanced intracellular survival protein [uncultured Quadrisphaera sp.]